MLKTTLLILAVALLTAAILFGGLGAWFWYEMRQGSRVDLIVSNHSARTLNAMIVQGVSSSPEVEVRSVAPGTTATHDRITGHLIDAAQVRVEVGGASYVGEAGVLLDDDGPHRFTIQAYDDRVIVTRQSNEQPATVDMRPIASATQAAR